MDKKALDKNCLSEENKTLYVTPDTTGLDYRSVLNQIVDFINIGDVVSKIQVDKQYIVQVPAQFREALDSGELFMMKNQKSGIMWPSLMEVAENGKNQIVTPLPISEQRLAQGNPVQSLSIGYHNLLMQQQMNRLTKLVEKTYSQVMHIERGQMDDRIGLLEAGKNGLLLALSMPEGEERTSQINSSRQNILESQAQIGRALQSRVKEFDEFPKTGLMRFIREFFDNGYHARKDVEIAEMQDYYDLYLQATRLLAASYAISGDVKTAEISFEIGERCMREIDFSAVKSVSRVHKDLGEMFYSNPVEYISVEKEICLEQAKPYDYVVLEVSGETLLEVIGNGREEALSEENI